MAGKIKEARIKSRKSSTFSELIASGQNVVIVIFETTAEKTILRMEYEKLFHKENSLVKITSISGAKSNHFL